MTLDTFNYTYNWYFNLKILFAILNPAKQKINSIET